MTPSPPYTTLEQTLPFMKQSHQKWQRSPKLITRILSNHLMVVAPSLIHPDQAGFIKGHYIENQIDLIKIMINTCEADGQNGTIVCLNQEKAYDKIMHP